MGFFLFIIFIYTLPKISLDASQVFLDEIFVQPARTSPIQMSLSGSCCPSSRLRNRNRNFHLSPLQLSVQVKSGCLKDYTWILAYTGEVTSLRILNSACFKLLFHNSSAREGILGSTFQIKKRHGHLRHEAIPL